MSMRRTEPKAIFDAPETVAGLLDSEEMFGVLTRSYTVPGGAAAMVIREQGDRVVYGSGATIAADGVAELLVARTGVLELKFAGLTADSVDGYRCNAAVTLRVSLVPDAAELASFRRSVMAASRRVDDRAVREYLTSHVSRASLAAADGRGVEALMDPRNQETIAREMADMLKEVVFSAGLRLEGPIDAHFDSPVYRQDRAVRAEAKRRQEQFAASQAIEAAREAARQRHAGHLSELLTKLSQLAEQSPHVDLADLIKTFPQEDRGAIYAGVLGAEGERVATRSLVVAAGRELLFFDADALESPHWRTSMSEAVGAVRSVQTAIDAREGRRLLVGASTGVHELAADGSGRVTTYVADTASAVKGGVNSVTLAGEWVVASHSELGLMYWPRGGRGAAKPVASKWTTGAKAVRCVRFFNGHLYFSVDERILKLPADALDAQPVIFHGSRAFVSALHTSNDGLFAGNAEGQILRWAADATDDPQLLHAGRQRSAESVVLLDAGGLRRLYFTDTSTAVHACVLGDAFICRYEAGGQTLRRAAVGSDLIVAVNEARDRLFFWRHGQPDRPFDVAPVGQLTGRSVQDFCLVPA